MNDYKNSNYLEHHGVKGMHWGERRYQNRDGSLTALGRMRRGIKGTGRKAGGAVSDLGDAVRKRQARSRALNAQKKKIRNDVKAKAQKQRDKEKLAKYKEQQAKKYGYLSPSQAKAKKEADARKAAEQKDIQAVKDKKQHEEALKKASQESVKEKKKLFGKKKEETDYGPYSSKTLSKKGINNMTNQELNAAIERARLENAYAQEMSKQKPSHPIKKRLADEALNVSIDLGKRAINSYAEKALGIENKAKKKNKDKDQNTNLLKEIRDSLAEDKSNKKKQQEIDKRTKEVANTVNSITSQLGNAKKEYDVGAAVQYYQSGEKKNRVQNIKAGYDAVKEIRDLMEAGQNSTYSTSSYTPTLDGYALTALGYADPKRKK